MKQRDDVMDLIQDFDAITRKLTATRPQRVLDARWHPETGSAIHLAPNAGLRARRQPRARYGALAKSIVIVGFLVVGAVFGTLIS